MKYINRTTATYDYDDNVVPNHDEYVIRRSIGKIIESMPIDELKKVFNIEKIDPRDKESKIKYRDEEFFFIMAQNKVVEYIVSINTDKFNR